MVTAARERGTAGKAQQVGHLDRKTRRSERLTWAGLGALTALACATGNPGPSAITATDKGGLVPLDVPAARLEAAHAPRRLAVAVGIGSFDDPSWRRLRYPEKDAADVTRILADGMISIDALFQREPSEGAAPTEQLIALARTTAGPIWVKCFPRIPWIAEEAVHIGAGKPPSTVRWTDPGEPAAVFCYQK